VGIKSSRNGKSMGVNLWRGFVSGVGGRLLSGFVDWRRLRGSLKMGGMARKRGWMNGNYRRLGAEWIGEYGIEWEGGSRGWVEMGLGTEVLLGVAG
jgi:hypothetical protein